MMCKQMIYLVCFVLVLSIAGNASADLVLHWPLDGDATDFSGNGYDGTVGGTANWVTGQIGLALDFDGSSTYIDLDDQVVEGTWSLAMWLRPRDLPYSDGFYAVMHTDAWGAGSVHLHLRNTTSLLNADINSGPGVTSTTVLQADEWYHAVVTVTNEGGNASQMYINGVLENTGSGGSGVAYLGDLNFGTWHDGTERYYHGLMDDIRVYDHVLSEVEILSAMTGKVWPYAGSPTPADGDMVAATWVNLVWRAGGLAVSHDIYLGENFDDVNDGTPDSSGFRGNLPLTTKLFFAGFIGNPYPDGLVPGTTYYWRIDEVNDTDPNSPWKGPVWSFWIQPRTAYNPKPADGVKFADPNVELNWSAGLDARLHYVYFGDNFDDVNSATGGDSQGPTTYTPGTLEFDKTYYWRVDESPDNVNMLKGDVWSFKTLPDVAITDPNLVGWWKLDEGMGTTAVDWSGHGNHGTLQGDPQWVAGYDGGALEFDGIDDYVNIDGYKGINAIDGVQQPFSVANWFRITATSGNHEMVTWGTSAGQQRLTWRVHQGRLRTEHASGNLRGNTYVNDGEWHHGALVVTEGANLRVPATLLYVDGVEDTTFSGSDNTYNLTANVDVRIGMSGPQNGRYWPGSIDDVRIFNKALTIEEVQQTMRGDPLLAGVPNPANGSTLYIREAMSITWSAGENAYQHDVYFGTDRDAVADANASDTTGIYRGRQFGISYTPPEGVEWGGGPYYWRVDEYNTDATISEGKIWSFTVTDFIGIEDFEDYNDFEPDRIFDVWMDGWGVETNGSEIGYADPDFLAGEHFVETNIVHGGRQSMPYFYDNNFKYSEATYSPTQRDWTEEGVGVLSLWFRGHPAGFVEGPAGTYTMTGAGVDIWDQADEFRYAWKQLSGAGTISAQVLSVENTNGWAKAGVMIRESLDPGSKFAALFITPGNGCRFQARLVTGVDATSDSDVTTLADIEAPHWIRLERDAAGNFNAYNSDDGVTWTPLAWNPQSISMATKVYIGLALTSHNSGVTCVAEFSNVETTGAVTPPTWTQEAIGATMAANDPAPMYVALNGGTAIYHDNPDAAQIEEWTEWTIDLQAFTGVGLTNVNTLAIGFGDKNNLQAGGSGWVFFDDIRLYRSAP